VTRTLPNRRWLSHSVTAQALLSVVVLAVALAMTVRAHNLAARCQVAAVVPAVTVGAHSVDALLPGEAMQRSTLVCSRC
jgi:hypothetical protein